MHPRTRLQRVCAVPERQNPLGTHQVLPAATAHTIRIPQLQRAHLHLYQPSVLKVHRLHQRRAIAHLPYGSSFPVPECRYIPNTLDDILIGVDLEQTPVLNHRRVRQRDLLTTPGRGPAILQRPPIQRRRIPRSILLVPVGPHVHNRAPRSRLRAPAPGEHPTHRHIPSTLDHATRVGEIEDGHSTIHVHRAASDDGLVVSIGHQAAGPIGRIVPAIFAVATLPSTIVGVDHHRLRDQKQSQDQTYSQHGHDHHSVDPHVFAPPLDVIDLRTRFRRPTA